MYCAVPENITIVIVKTSYPLPTNGIKNSRGMGDSSRPKKKFLPWGAFSAKFYSTRFSQGVQPPGRTWSLKFSR